MKNSESSGSNTPGNYESNVNNDPVFDHSRNSIWNDNINERDSIVTARSSTGNSAIVHESSYSSGISVHPPSINNTGSSSIG